MREAVRAHLAAIVGILRPLSREDRAMVLNGLRWICEDCWQPTEAGPCSDCGATICPKCADIDGAMCCEAKLTSADVARAIGLRVPS